MENEAVFLGRVFLVSSGTRIGRMGMTRKWTEKIHYVVAYYAVQGDSSFRICGWIPKV